jgi:hypothetical protein
MAGEKISALPAIATPALSDIFPVVQAGVTYKETCTQFITLLSGSPTFVTPALGTPSSGILTNTTGYTIANLADIAWTDFSGIIGFTGFTGAMSINYARYKLIGKTVFVSISITGTSNSTSFTITGMPFTAKVNQWMPFCLGYDNSANIICSSSISTTTLAIYYGITSLATGWTNSGTKGFNGEFFYETV